MSTLIIQRTSEYSYKLSDYQIYIDDKDIGTISDGQTKELEINAGKHTLYAQLNWIILTPVVSFEITAGATKIFQVGSSKYGQFKHPKGVLYRLAALIIVSFASKIIFSIDYPHLLLAFTVVILVYYLMLGRNSYLTINELN